MIRHAAYETRQPLTDKQYKVLSFIRASIAKNGFPPVYTDIMRKFKFRGRNAVRCHLKALERKGAIKIKANAARGIRVIDQGFPATCPHCGGTIG